MAPSKATKPSAPPKKPQSEGTATPVEDPNTVYSLSIEEVNNNNDELIELRGSGRYFGATDDPQLNGPKCSNCHRRGHLRARCKVVVCHSCGKIGDHYQSQCPSLQFCTNCGNQGHFRSVCTEKAKRVYCNTCESASHGEDRCPSIWRSYLTIKVDKKIPMPTQSIYCYNCAAKGHFGDECPEYRASRTPNINGSAFSGNNLPQPLREPYFEILKRRQFEEVYESNDDEYVEMMELKPAARNQSRNASTNQSRNSSTNASRNASTNAFRNASSNAPSNAPRGPAQHRNPYPPKQGLPKPSFKPHNGNSLGSRITPNAPASRSGYMPPRGPKASSTDFPRTPNQGGRPRGNNQSYAKQDSSYNSNQERYPSRPRGNPPPRPRGNPPPQPSKSGMIDAVRGLHMGPNKRKKFSQ